jgi:hypothetical protein
MAVSGRISRKRVWGSSKTPGQNAFEDEDDDEYEDDYLGPLP